MSGAGVLPFFDVGLQGTSANGIVASEAATDR